MAKDTKPAEPANAPLQDTPIQDQALETTPDLEELLNQLAASEGLAAAYKDRLDVLETEAAALIQENEALRQQLTAKPEPGNSARVLPLRQGKPTAADLPTFEADGKQYQFRVQAFRIDSRKIIAADAIADPVLINLVVEKYPGLIREV